MPGGPEPRGRPKRGAPAEGVAKEEEVPAGGSSRRRKAECPRRRRSRRDMPGEEEELEHGVQDRYMEEDIVADKAPKREVEEEEEEEVVIQEVEPTIIIQDPPLEVAEALPLMREGVLRSSRSRPTPTLQLICKTEPEQHQLVYEINEGPSSFTGGIRDNPRSRRRAARAREEATPVEVKMEVKEEGQVVQEQEMPRKRGRRRKDDKSPRLPKRRKKPPIQYVRCEMEGCGTVLAHPRYLQHHIKYQHLLKKKYVCPHPSCGRLFRLQKQLLRHAKHHTDQRDYICEYCARAFKSSHNLAVHRMIHTGEKPLQCEFCGFTCRQKASLNWHMKKHDADSFYQFSCSICGKKFEKKDSVVAHKAKSHPEVLIAEALAANAGALITSPELLVPETPVPVAQEEPEPQAFYPSTGSKILVACPIQPVEGLGATTEVLIEDSDSAGP
ncbi:E3 ubiquitin-protein ligase ZFP91 isoform X5 [Spea bombifrons]|uniref:E3 ubiquitin-protein ligase ZFP91 isoform X5 n=1 Tax=Spea bombifrons TaxID=233779 RepID=UPI00234B75BA|nr:E3 ubiquitin-protein ligase ZFP91 isoform X5 [Spea bombifrons]